MNRDLLYLQDNLECVTRIASYTQAGPDEFLRNPLIQDAVIRNFEIIGEAAKGLSDEARERMPGIPWRQVCRFRDMLIHAYHRVRPDEVWAIVESDLVPLRDQVGCLLREWQEPTEEA